MVKTKKNEEKCERSKMHYMTVCPNSWVSEGMCEYLPPWCLCVFLCPRFACLVFVNTTTVMHAFLPSSTELLSALPS